ncbi:MAG: hypothetical protein WAV56_00260 [Microgenomates group bacterium]
MSNQNPEAIENHRRAEELAHERILTEEEGRRSAADLLLVARECFKTIPEVTAALRDAYFGAVKDREDLTKGKITFRRGGSVWEIVLTNAYNVEELSLTKLPPIEEKDPADFQEEMRIIIQRRHDEIIQAAIQYNHLFKKKGLGPIIHTHTNLAVQYAFQFLRDFTGCARRSL